MEGFVFSLKGLVKWPLIIFGILLLAICLTGALEFTGPLTTTYAAPAEWSGNGIQYTAGTQVTYQGKTYTCIIPHKSQPDWDPVDAQTLWELTNGSSNQPSSTPKPVSKSTLAGSSPKTFTGGCTAGVQDTWTPADGVFFQGRKNLHQVALTFDDGPFGPDDLQSSHNTRAVLNILEKNKIHATFFVIGEQVTSDPQQRDPSQVDPNADQVKLVNQEKNDGNEVADHSWTHPYLTKLPLAPNPSTPGDIHDVQDEIGLTSTVIKNAIGIKPVDFRPPYGDTNQSVQSAASKLGLPTIGWTIDSCDWTQTLTGGAEKNDIVNNVLNYVTNGTIVLMHDGGNDRSQTVAALPTIIQGLKNKGYQFVTVQQMVKEAAQP
ncbi:MAG TPA: polysaccharide deacetylase family protein [Ktedonobacteraceae bacterium]|jgi:peptidoglycan/xylan/chitin deacetylase (PgdA/CDA1 family)